MRALVKINNPLSEIKAHEILNELLGVRFENRNEIHDLIEKIYFDKAQKEIEDKDIVNYKIFDTDDGKFTQLVIKGDVINEV